MNSEHGYPIAKTKRAALSTACLASLLILAACTTKQVVIVPQDSKPAVEAKVDVGEKKRAFFAQMKPLVEKENARIIAQREALLKMRADREIGWLQRRKLAALADEYEVKIGDKPGTTELNRLIERVDVVPVEMALVQAANESAWGESRFAAEGNNYFGQWCYSKGCGIVPEQRSAGASHEVRRFDSAQDSVRAYMNNINTTRAYASFRKLRAEQRSRNQKLDAVHLALGLKSYSERGMAYVKTIQSMIRSNRALIASSRG